MAATTTLAIGVLALAAFVVAGVAFAAAPGVAPTGGADASGHPSADVNGVPPGPPVWLNDSTPHGPPEWITGGGPPDWLVLP